MQAAGLRKKLFLFPFFLFFVGKRLCEPMPTYPFIFLSFYPFILLSFYPFIPLSKSPSKLPDDGTTCLFRPT